MDLLLMRHNLLLKMSKDIEYLETLHRKSASEGKRELELAIDVLEQARSIVERLSR